jgi:hypothetical protein
MAGPTRSAIRPGDGPSEAELIDLATCQSEQVYIIAVADEAWVVGIGCTAARPALITSVEPSSAGCVTDHPLGNLTALVSV